jgi:hypothetical protein
LKGVALRGTHAEEKPAAEGFRVEALEVEVSL